MPTFLADISVHIKSIWSRLDSGQRLTIATVVAATVVGLGAMVWYAGQPSYDVLYTATDTASYDDAMQALDGGNIPRKTKGLEISVPGEYREMARSVLRDAGVGVGSAKPPLGGIGKTGKEVDNQIWRGRVAATEAKIKRSKQIRDVVVAAYRPAPPRFGVDKNRSTATVTITVAPGFNFQDAAELALDMTAGDLSFPRDSVIVRDSESSEMYRHSDKGAGSASGKGFLRMQEDWEYRLQTKANRVLAEVYQDNVRVVVNVALDPNLVEKTGVNIPEEGITPNFIETTNKNTEEGTSAVHSAGPPEDAQAATQVAPAKPAKTSDKIEKKETDPKLYGTKIETQMAPHITRITASVVLNEEIFADPTVQEAERTKIREIVNNTIGIDETRDGVDAVTVAFGKFAPPPPIAEPVGMDYMQTVRDFAPAVGQVLAVLLVILFLRGMMKRVQPKSVLADATGSDLDDEPENLAPEEAARRMRKEIEKAIGEDPAAISRMLDNWLTEQRA